MKKFGTPIGGGAGERRARRWGPRPSARRRRRRPGPAPRAWPSWPRPSPRRPPGGARRRAPWPWPGRPPWPPAARPGRPGARPWAWPRCPARPAAWRPGPAARWRRGPGPASSRRAAWPSARASARARRRARPRSALTIAPGTTSASVLPSGTVTRRTWPEGSCTSKTAIGRCGQHGAAEAGQEDASRRQADEQLALLHAWVQSSPAARPEGNAVPVGADEPSTASPRRAQEVLPAWDAVQRRAVSRGRAGMATWAFGPRSAGARPSLNRDPRSRRWEGRGAAPRRSLTLKSKVRYVPHRPRARFVATDRPRRGRARPSGVAVPSRPMTDETNDGLRERLARSGEDALGAPRPGPAREPAREQRDLAGLRGAGEGGPGAGGWPWAPSTCPPPPTSSASPAGCGRSPSAWRASRTASTASTTASPRWGGRPGCRTSSPPSGSASRRSRASSGARPRRRPPPAAAPRPTGA